MEMVPKLKILTVLLFFPINIGSAGGDRALYALPLTYTTYSASSKQHSFILWLPERPKACPGRPRGYRFLIYSSETKKQHVNNLQSQKIHFHL